MTKTYYKNKCAKCGKYMEFMGIGTVAEFTKDDRLKKFLAADFVCRCGHFEEVLYYDCKVKGCDCNEFGDL